MLNLTVNQAQSKLDELIEKVEESDTEIKISGKRSTAVLLSEKHWNAVQETLFLLSIPKMGRSIKEGMAESISKGKRTPKW